jgi:hypothetical protein
MERIKEKLIAVVGATGKQGSAVVRALQAGSQFKVRRAQGGNNGSTRCPGCRCQTFCLPATVPLRHAGITSSALRSPVS